MKGSNYNGNQNSIKFSKKQLTFNTERTEKVLIGFTSKLSFKVKHTDTEQADIFRTKARYIHLFFANGKADSTKDFNSKDKHGTEDYSNKNINDKNEHSGKDFNSQEATTTKSTSAASNKNCDTFTYTSPAAKTAVKLTQKGTVSAQKNTKVNQTKTAVKNNASNKIAVSGSLSKNKTKSAQNTVPDGLKLHLKHTTDPKQKAGMRKNAEDYAAGKVVDQVSQKLKEFGIDISKLHFGLNSQIKEAKLVTDAQIYELTADNNSGTEKEGFITQTEYDRMLYIITHENGTTQNASTDMFATASALLNSFEAQDYYAKYGSMSSKLSAFESNNAGHGLFDANNGSAPKVQELGHQVLDIVLSGVRIDGINCWTGDGSTAFFSSTWDEDWRKNSAAFKAGLI